jgi:CRISPR-associated protein Csb2
MALGHVGHEHADGHLLGMALALPHGMALQDEEAVLDALAEACDPETGELELHAGRAGSMLLAEDSRSGLPRALRAETWTGPSVCWGSVTPIAIDRLPPRRHEGNDAWVAEQLSESCTRQGLPAPVEVGILPVSPHRGAPPCRAFPPLLRKPDGARRWHVHARIRFAESVEGPLLLGAGRYRGYGLCKPLPLDSAASE